MIQPIHNHIVLASRSPRRRALLEQVGVVHGSVAADIDETRARDESAVAYIERMVDQKAQAALAVLQSVPTGAAADGADKLVITADTIGVLANGQVLQKPADFAEACTMWHAMSGTTHQVWTAVQVTRVGVADPNTTAQVRYQQRTLVKTEVEFITLSDEAMAAYWATGEPQDKAGGYAIQGIGAAWVKAICGSYTNVVGLPLVETLALLRAADGLIAR